MTLSALNAGKSPWRNDPAASALNTTGTRADGTGAAPIFATARSTARRATCSGFARSPR